MSAGSNKKKMWRDDGGNVGIQFGMMLVPMVMLIGGSIDIGRAMHAHSELQSAVDAGALAAASSTTQSAQQRMAMAGDMIQNNIGNVIKNVKHEVAMGDAKVTVSATGNVSTNFLGIVGVDQLAIEARAVAKSSFDPSDSSTDLGKVCILALDPNSTNGLQLQGTGDLLHPNCWAYTNSSRPEAIYQNSNTASAVGEGHCAVGGFGKAGQGTDVLYSPAPKTACAVVPDPYATVGAYSGGTYTPTFTPPTKPNTCVASNLNLKKGTYTLEPGRYCGGFVIMAQATVRLLPGVYYIDNGAFDVRSGASLTIAPGPYTTANGYTAAQVSKVNGTGVMFYLDGQYAKATIQGGGTINLQGRGAGSSYPGFLVIAKPDTYLDKVSLIQGGGTFQMEGVVYTPTQAIEVGGNGNVNVDGTYMGIVAKDCYFKGNGQFKLSKHLGSSSLPDIMPSVPRQQKQDAYLSE